MIYYIADTHFGDWRIFDKCSRPFKDVNEMNEEMIRRWNAKVKKDDAIYVLGDLAEERSPDSLQIFLRLNGEKHLILGNHDLPMLQEIRSLKIFESIKFAERVEDKGRSVFLCHYPLMDWDGFPNGGYHVYGHIHNKSGRNSPAYVQMKDYFQDKLAFNCGVDVTNYKPVTLDEMIKLKEINKDEPYLN